jgi:hypothetical protein
MSTDAELIDRVKSINNDFFTMLKEMKESTDYLKYRRFVHRYVSDQKRNRMLLDLIREAEKASVPLNTDLDFWGFLNMIADEEFLKKKAEFKDEAIKVGWMG